MSKISDQGVYKLLEDRWCCQRHVLVKELVSSHVEKIAIDRINPGFMFHQSSINNKILSKKSQKSLICSLAFNDELHLIMVNQ